MTDLPKRGSREFDALVAEKVLCFSPGHDWPVSDANIDYSVLVKVREWSGDDQIFFDAELERLWWPRSYPDDPFPSTTLTSQFALNYEPGDYAEAALRVKMSNAG